MRFLDPFSTPLAVIVRGRLPVSRVLAITDHLLPHKEDNADIRCHMKQIHHHSFKISSHSFKPREGSNVIHRGDAQNTQSKINTLLACYVIGKTRNSHTLKNSHVKSSNFLLIFKTGFNSTIWKLSALHHHYLGK